MALRSLSAALLAASLSLVTACGSSGGGGSVTPEGTHYHYVASRVMVPTKAGDARAYGLDLNGDGVVDNALGSLLAALFTQGINAQSAIDEAVFGGDITLLVDYQTKDFTSASASGVQVLLGANPQPPACNTGEMVTCGSGTDTSCTGCQHDLDGQGMFSIDPASPNNAALAGPVTGGTFKGGPGSLTLEVSLTGSDPIELDLIGARAQGAGITATAIGTQTDTTSGMILGGAITMDDLDTKVIPAVVTIIGTELSKHCTALTTPPTCGCDSTGSTIINLFDSNHDCMVTASEIEMSQFASSLLAPDVTIDGKAALSVGVKAFGVGATYTVTGETM